MLTIAKLAEAGGVGVETVRFYQRRGLMRVPERPPAGGVRRYGTDDRQRLRFIRAAKEAGFALDQIEELLRLDATLDRAGALTLARRQLASLNQQIAKLIATRDALARLADSCTSGEAGPCPIITAFESPG